MCGKGWTPLLSISIFEIVSVVFGKIFKLITHQEDFNTSNSLLFFSKTLHVVDEDGALTHIVAVIEARVEGTSLISFLAKLFKPKGLLMNCLFLL